MVVPKEYRQKLGIKEGDEVIWTEVDGQIVLTSRKQQIERAQQLCAALFADQPERSLVDELIAERRVDSLREEDEAAAPAPKGRVPSA